MSELTDEEEDREDKVRCGNCGSVQTACASCERWYCASNAECEGFTQLMPWPNTDNQFKSAICLVCMCLLAQIDRNDRIVRGIRAMMLPMPPGFKPTFPKEKPRTYNVDLTELTDEQIVTKLTKTMNEMEKVLTRITRRTVIRHRKFRKEV